MSHNIIRLGKYMGRFGNQLQTYAAVRSFAEKLGADFECPLWVGREIFTGVDDALPSVGKLPTLPADAIPTKAPAEVYGYYQFQEACDAMSLTKIRQRFTVKPEWLARWTRPRPYYIAAHLRRTDYCRRKDLAAVAHTAYERAIVAAGYSLDNVIWVSDDPAATVHVHRSGEWPKHLDFLGDFLTLAHADVVFRANSTFSFWAAVLNRQAAAVYSPVVGDKVGMREDIEFVLGNHAMNFSHKYHPKTRHTDMRIR